MLQADHGSVAWNVGKKHWEVRIQVGEEVMIRKIAAPGAESGADALKAKAVEIAKDEGYELDPANVAVEESSGHSA
jgi:hypothetical protein